jgi:hypothetical protein
MGYTDIIKEVDVKAARATRDAALNNLDEAVQTMAEAYNYPMTADNHRAKGKEYQSKADELKAGEKKDAYAAAAKAHNDAADCIDAAHKSTAKAAALD